jgi:hypothetical protein
MTYRGTTQLWSNRHHFLGGTPADLSHWYALMDAVVLAEKAALGSWNTIVSCSGYVAGSNVAAATKTYTTAGTLSTTGEQRAPGDVAALIRFSTAARTTKGHPVYLFSYMHGATISTSTVDNLGGLMLAGLQTYGTAWLTGFSDGTNTYTRAGPNGAAATARTVLPQVTHRDFPR